MFDLFPKKKSVEELVDSVGPFDVYRPVQTPSILQAQNDLIEQFLKENYDLKVENQKLKNEIKQWEHDWDIQNNNIKRLERENIDLTDRVNEIDSDVIRDLKDEILVLKNENALWKAKHQIIQNDYKKCTEQRDEFKHQLNAANKENEFFKREWKFQLDNMGKLVDEKHELLKEIDQLKSKLRDYQDKYAESFSHNDMNKLQKIIDEQKKEIKKLKEDIVDYVIEKDDELEKTKNWNRLNEVKTEKVYVCNHCGYKVAHDTSYWGGCGFCKDGLMIEREEVVQKHPLYPIHWGGYDGAASAHPEEYKKWLYEQRDKAIAEKQREEEKWICPCNKCKEQRGE